MINNSLYLTQCEEALEMFSNYMNEINYMINKVKKSIYEISNIKMPLSEVLVQNNVASLTVNKKKTLDQLKKIASILRGYSKSKINQREQEQTRKSKFQVSSRTSRSRLSKCTNCQSYLSPSKIERTTTNGIDKQNQQINMVTFQVPTPQNKRHHNQKDQLMKKLKNYHSLRNLNRKSDNLSNSDAKRQNYQNTKFNNTSYSGIHNNSPIHNNTNQQSLMQCKRSRTSQKPLYNSSISRVLTQTQNKFKQCFEKRDSGLNEIIKNHYECLQILNDIHTHLKNKKSKKNSQPSSPIQQLFNGGIGKVSAVYKAMTPSNKKQHQILVQ